MKYILSILAMATILCACNNQKQTVEEVDTTNIDSTVTTTTPTNAIKCYTFKSKALEVNLYIEQYGSEVTGRLSYDFAEKDDNEGLLKGYFYGDTLIAEYAFKSEGTTSVREVAFIKKGTQLIEGYGEVEEKDKVFVFKDRSALKFTGEPLTESPCTN